MPQKNQWGNLKDPKIFSHACQLKSCNWKYTNYSNSCKSHEPHPKIKSKNERPMYTGLNLNKNFLTQEQFTEDLRARLKKLAHERNYNSSENSRECSVGMCSPPSITWPQNKLEDMNNIKLKIEQNKDESANFNFDLSSFKRIENNSINSNKLNHFELQSGLPKDFNQRSLSVVIDLKQKKEEVSVLCLSDFRPTPILKSIGEHKDSEKSIDDNVNLINQNRYDDLDDSYVSYNSESDDQQMADDELECLDYDKPIINRNESVQELSDSELSCEEKYNNCLEHLQTPVIASLFPNVSSVIRFVGDNQKVTKLPKPYRYRLKWRPSTITPNVVKRALRRSHFRFTLKSPDWIGYFGNHLKPMGFRPVREYQKVNHFPGSFQLGRKDKLWMNICRMRDHFGRKAFDFVPRTFCLPAELRLLKELWARYETPTNNSGSDPLINQSRPKWILKPPASARGMGVKLVRSWSEVPKQRHVIVQSYISRPLLINGTKFDLRIYVFVTGFNPLRVYVHREGLVRFASQHYSTSLCHTENRYIHLTNYSVNKHNPNEETGVINHKWKLSDLWSYLNERNIDVKKLWLSITELIFKTLASVVPYISIMVDQNCRRRASVYELFGFDILLDADLKPWLIEVNVSPSLHTNTALDNEVKTAVVIDMFNVVGFQLPPDFSRSVNSFSSSNEEPNSNSTTSSNGYVTTTTDEVLHNIINKKISKQNSCCHQTNIYSQDHYRFCQFRNGRTSRSPKQTAGISLPVSRNRTPTTQSYLNGKRIHALPPPSPLGNSIVKRSYSSIGTVKCSRMANDKHINYSLLPLYDPKLWDNSLTIEERHKHINFSESFLKIYKERCSDRLSRINQTRKSERKNKFPCGFVSNNSKSQTLEEHLHAMLSHLTTDDLRTLIHLMDERYRAALGNFQCIFPKHGEYGFQLLRYLEGSSTEKNFCGSRSRTAFHRYYDLLQHAYLTVYHDEFDENQPSCESFVKCNFKPPLPDFVSLYRGKLTSEAIELAAKMVGIKYEGLERLISQCYKSSNLCSSYLQSHFINKNTPNYNIKQSSSPLKMQSNMSELTIIKPSNITVVNVDEGGDTFTTPIGGNPNLNNDTFNIANIMNNTDYDYTGNNYSKIPCKPNNIQSSLSFDYIHSFNHSNSPLLTKPDQISHFNYDHVDQLINSNFTEEKANKIKPIKRCSSVRRLQSSFIKRNDLLPNKMYSRSLSTSNDISNLITTNTPSLKNSSNKTQILLKDKNNELVFKPLKNFKLSSKISNKEIFDESHHDLNNNKRLKRSQTSINSDKSRYLTPSVNSNHFLSKSKLMNSEHSLTRSHSLYTHLVYRNLSYSTNNVKKSQSGCTKSTLIQKQRRSLSVNNSHCINKPTIVHQQFIQTNLHKNLQLKLTQIKPNNY